MVYAISIGTFLKFGILIFVLVLTTKGADINTGQALPNSTNSTNEETNSFEKINEKTREGWIVKHLRTYKQYLNLKLHFELILHI